jgi:hypothetical protein
MESLLLLLIYSFKHASSLGKMEFKYYGDPSVVFKVSIENSTYPTDTSSYCVMPGGISSKGTGNCLGGEIFFNGAYMNVAMNKGGGLGSFNQFKTSYFFDHAGLMVVYNQTTWKVPPKGANVIPTIAGDYVAAGLPIEGIKCLSN